jgi:uncharacterized HhH-GPD family protein
MVQITQDETADQLLSTNGFALLAGMLLDQQFPMEQAFSGPAKIQQRFGTLDPDTVAAADPEQFAELCSRPPAVHRFPSAMAARLQAVAAVVVQTYGCKAERLWDEAGTGQELLRRVSNLPGFGRQKSQIFVALLGKQLGVQPPGWREAAGGYGEAGVFKSVADVIDPDTLAKVRAYKKEQKARARQP